MTARIQRRFLYSISLLLGLAALISCAEGGDEVIVSADFAEAGVADQADGLIFASGAVADDSAPFEIVPEPLLPFEIVPEPLLPTVREGLVGTRWSVTSVNGEPYDGGELSIGENGAAGETYRVAFADLCSAGRTWFRVRSADNLEVYPDRNAPCPGHPTSVLRGEDGGPITVTLIGDELYVETSNGALTAELTATSADGSMPPLSMLPVVDVEWPDQDAMRAENLSQIEEATDIRVPECPSTGEAGLEDDPLADERLAISQRFSMVIGELPFVVSNSGAGGNLHHHEMGVGLSVRYQPSIDWIAENIPEGHVCIEIPPPGYYDSGPTLAAWEFDLPTEATDTTLSIRLAMECAPPDSLVMAPVVVETDTTVKVAFPLAKAPYGASIESMCAEVTPTVISLDSPLGDRDIVPLTNLRG